MSLSCYIYIYYVLANITFYILLVVLEYLYSILPNRVKYSLLYSSIVLKKGLNLRDGRRERMLRRLVVGSR